MVCCAWSLTHVWLFVTPWTVAHQVPLSMGILQTRILEWVCHALLQGIFPTQGSNPGLSCCRQILYHLSHQGSQNTGVGSLSLLQGNFRTQELSQGFLHCRRILYQLNHQGSPLQYIGCWNYWWTLIHLFFFRYFLTSNFNHQNCFF